MQLLSFKFVQFLYWLYWWVFAAAGMRYYLTASLRQIRSFANLVSSHELTFITGKSRALFSHTNNVKTYGYKL